MSSPKMIIERGKFQQQLVSVSILLSAMKDMKVQSQNEVYERLKLLGQGAFGKAYLVKERATGFMCVVKQMNMSDMTAAEQEETLKEAKILEALNHPNIVKFKQVYVTTNKKLNIVMEYADGGDISKRIAEQKKTGKHFNQAIVLDWFTQMCLAIKHVHDRKIIHRDIKGQNIFITKNNMLKLGDFGIAKILNKTMEKAKTVVGTPYYLSPEIIQSKPYSYKSDIWSMGVLLYQMCALQPPFNANSLQFLALKIVKGSYQPIQGNFSKQVKGLIAQMLSTDPNKRPTVTDILRLPFVLSRINNFLTQTQNKVEFSHTVLHNFKLNFKAIAPNNPQPQAPSQPASQPSSQIENQRLKLKDDQMRMEKLRQEQKARQKQKIMEQRKAYEDQKRQAEQKKKVAQYNKQMEDKKRQKQTYQKEQRRLEEKRLVDERREKEQRRNLQQYKKIEEKQKQKAYLEFAKAQWIKNQEIRKNAQRRAMMDEGGYQSEPQFNQQNAPLAQPVLQNKKSQHSEIKQPTKQNAKVNFHYKQDHTKQSLDEVFPKVKPQEPQRPSSVNKNRVEPEVGDDQLMNAMVNPNFAKKKDQPQPKRQEQPKKIERPVSVKPSKQLLQETSKQEKQNQLKKRIEEGRMKMREDKQKRMGSTADISNDDSLQTEASTDKTIRGNKWQKPAVIPKPTKSVITNPSKKSPEKKQDPTIRGAKWEKESPIVKADVDDLNEVIQQNHQIEKFLQEEITKQQKRNSQMEHMIAELKKIVEDTNEKIEALPEIRVNIHNQMRKDDQEEPEKASEFHRATIYSQEDANLEYFSDYNKLESLRMTLQDVFGTQNFVKVYRIIEKEFDADDMGALDVDKIKKKVDFIDQDLLEQHFTHLLTVVVMENKVNESCR